MKRPGIIFVIITLMFLLVSGCGGGGKSSPGGAGGSGAITGYLYTNGFSLQITKSSSPPQATTPVNGGIITIAGTTFTATTGSNGYFSISGVPVGSYTLNAEHNSTTLQSLLNVTADGQSAPATKTTIYLMQGNDHQTPAYIFDSGIKGNTVMLVGGTHGDEIAGWHSVGRICDDYLSGARIVRSGRLIIVPKMNITGVKAGVRRLDNIDLNRQYPGLATGDDAQKLAYQVDRIMTQYDVAMLIDCHESLTLRSADPDGLGNTIIASAGEARTMAKAVAASLNAKMGFAETNPKYWRDLVNPVTGSTAWNIYANHGSRPGFTVETYKSDPLETRITEQIFIVEQLLRQKGF